MYDMFNQFEQRYRMGNAFNRYLEFKEGKGYMHTVYYTSCKACLKHPPMKDHTRCILLYNVKQRDYMPLLNIIQPYRSLRALWHPGRFRGCGGGYAQLCHGHIHLSTSQLNDDFD